MLSSIHPLGERAKGNRFAVTATAFVVASTLGGATTGLAAAGLGALVDLAGPSGEVRVALVALAAAGAAAAELTGRRLPSARRQVDENWLQEFRGWVYGAGYGFQLGTGVVTYITSAAVYAAVVAAVLAGSTAVSVAVMAAFGLVRGVSILPASSIDSADRLARFHRRLADTAGPVRRAASTLLALGATVAVATIV